MIITGIVIAYIFTAIAVGRAVYNTTLEKEYKEQLVKAHNLSEYVRDGLTVEEYAYKYAKLFGNCVESAIFMGSFVRVGLIYLLVKKVPAIGHKLIPKNSVVKEVEASRNRIVQKEKLEAQIISAKELGIDADIIRAMEAIKKDM